jgi:hypothetical protein
MKLRLVACFVLLGIASLSPAQDKKKNLIVRADQSARQVNNHPYSYTTPGQASTDCSTYGTVNANGTTYGNTTNVNGTVNADTNCNTTYRPPQTTSGNIVTVDNASWVTDINSGDRYLIQCTAHWAGSKCSYLEEGTFKAVLEGNTMLITGMKGMKEMTAKYHVLRYTPGSHSPVQAAALSNGLANVSSRVSSALTEEERFNWQWYTTLPEEDKKYVAEFCPANPTGKALLPRAKINAGEPAERALYCQPWLSAKAKQ